MNTSTDRIEKEIVLHASRSRVWRALVVVEEFNQWFGVALDGAVMTPGARLQGRITFKGFEHLVMAIEIERVEPERLLSWRWHPAAIERDVDYSAEPMTRVTFELSEVRDGTRLTVIESGFDALPAHRRTTSLRLNTDGWETQMSNIATHVAR